MIIGVDFDNTIVCYDNVIYRVAVQKGFIPTSLSATKEVIRDYLRNSGKEEAWTELQGYIYGSVIKEAPPFPGVKDFFSHYLRQGINLSIISHKTLYPFLGPKYDLHRAAHEWLDFHGFYDPSQIGLSPSQVYFELTKQQKLDRIAKIGCTHFIDDLPEFLSEPSFPSSVQRILFNPTQDHSVSFPYWQVSSWREILSTLSC